MRAKTPHWDLDRVKELAVQPNGLFVQVNRALAFFGGDRKAALAACRNTIGQLTWRQFAETQHLTWDVADIYGVNMIDGSG